MKMSLLAQLVNHKDNLQLSPGNEENSSHISLGDEEENPWATIQIDTWNDNHGYVVEWPTAMDIGDFKSLIPPTESRSSWNAVAVFSHEGTQVRIESTYEYVHTEIQEPEDWESLRVIVGPIEFAIFVTHSEVPNRFELVSKNGDVSVFTEIFGDSMLVTGISDIDPVRLERLVTGAIS